MFYRSDTPGARVLWLAIATIAVAVVALYPAIRWFGGDGVVALVISAVSCFVPGCGILLLERTLANEKARTSLVLWSTALRVVAALLGALVMDSGLGLAPANYLVWLGLFYLVSLFVETWLLLPRAALARRGVPRSAPN